MAAEHFTLDYFQIIADQIPTIAHYYRLLPILRLSSIIAKSGECSNDAMNWSDDDKRLVTKTTLPGAVNNDSSTELLQHHWSYRSLSPCWCVSWLLRLNLTLHAVLYSVQCASVLYSLSTAVLYSLEYSTTPVLYWGRHTTVIYSKTCKTKTDRKLALVFIGY